MNKYLRLSLVLGGICLLSGGIIAGTYAITHERIAQNEVEAEMKGLKNLYPTANDFSRSYDVKDEKYPYLLKYYDVYQDNDELGYIFKTTGKNAYGSITALYKISLVGSIGEIYLIEDTQTYKDTLETEYVNKYNRDKRDLEDVTCGATFGATLIKDMAYQAQDYYLNVVVAK